MAQKQDTDTAAQSDKKPLQSVFSETDVIFIPTEKALGRIKDGHSSGNRKNTHSSKKLTLIGEKLKDVCISCLQEKWRGFNYDINAIVAECEMELQSVFREKGLVISDDTGQKRIDEINIMRTHMIYECVKSKIDFTPLVCVEIPFEKFIRSLGLNTYTNAIDGKNRFSFGRVISEILHIQKSSLYEWTIYVPDSEYEKIEKKIIRTYTIPQIEFTITNEGMAFFDSIDDLVTSRKRNKKQYIKSVTIGFDYNSIINHVLFPTRKTALHTKMRQSLGTVYAFRLDELIRAIMWQQEMQKRPVFFSPNDLMSKFGVSYKQYRHFKSKVLVPAIENFNTHSTDIRIRLKETRNGQNKEVTAIYFVIEKIVDPTNALIKEVGKPFISCYIASRIFYVIEKNHPRNEEEFIPFLQFIDEEVRAIKSDDDTRFGSSPKGATTFGEWKEEALEAKKAHDRIITVLPHIRNALEKRKIYYDEKKMMLCAKQDEKPVTMFHDIQCADPIDSIELLKIMIPEYFEQENF